MTATQRFIKRSIDILFALTVLVLLSPVWLAIVIAVRLTSRGPIIFRQQRVGLNGEEFTMLKFRTMIDNAPDLRNDDGSTYNAPDDPRLTPVGKFLRRASLDELPQFLNVLTGDMSVVGPRPDLPDQISEYRPEDYARLEMKPGITSLAIIHGRNTIPWEERRAWDVRYVRQWTPGIDIRILLKTIPIVLSMSGIWINGIMNHNTGDPPD